MYGLCNKLVCLSKPVKVIGNRKDASLLCNLPMVRKLRLKWFIVQAQKEFIVG